MNVFLSSKMKLSEIFQYDRVTSSSDSDLDVDGGEKQSDQLLEDASLYSVSMKQKARNGMISYLTCIVFILACGLAFAAGLNWEPNFAQRCLEHVSFYSPVLRVMDERYENVQFNGSLGFPSKYRGTPGPEVDEAWNNVEEVLVMGISAEEALAVGGTLDDARLPEEMGGGYMASVEVVHQLHCLNFLRKATHQDYYQSRALEFQDPPHTVRVHLDHCIEMLRQFLMCNADAGLYTHRWIENYPRPYPNFNTWHKCRNFENVLEYAKSHQIKPPPGWHYPVPAGAHIFPDAQVPSEAPQLSEIPVV